MAFATEWVRGERSAPAVVLPFHPLYQLIHLSFFIYAVVFNKGARAFALTPLPYFDLAINYLNN